MATLFMILTICCIAGVLNGNVICFCAVFVFGSLAMFCEIKAKLERERRALSRRKVYYLP